MYTTGGSKWSGGDNTTCYEFDPVANTWTAKASYPGAPISDGVGFAINGKGYIGIGTGFSVSSARNELWEYDPVADFWTRKANYPESEMSNGLCFVFNNKGYVGSNELSKSMYEYDPLAD